MQLLVVLRIWTSKDADCNKEDIDSIVKDSAALPVWLTAERARQYYLEGSGPQVIGKSVLCNHPINFNFLRCALVCNSGRLEPDRQLKRSSWPTTSWITSSTRPRRVASPRRSWHSRMSFSKWQSNLALNAQCWARSLVLSPAGSSEGQGGA